MPKTDNDKLREEVGNIAMEAIAVRGATGKSPRELANQLDALCDAINSLAELRKLEDSYAQNPRTASSYRSIIDVFLKSTASICQQINEADKETDDEQKN